MGLFVKVVYIRKDNTKAERTIWERIDAEGEPGIWTTTDPINFMDSKHFEDDDRMIGYSAGRAGASRKKKQVKTYRSSKADSTCSIAADQEKLQDPRFYRSSTRLCSKFHRRYRRHQD
jgi:hypothetical protein